MAVLDPKREYVKYRFYRDSCLNADDTYIKDLNILGRDINKILIVDNTLHAFAYQVMPRMLKTAKNRWIMEC